MVEDGWEVMCERSSPRGRCDGDVELQEPDADGRGDDEKVACVVLTDAAELGAMQVGRRHSKSEAAWH